MTRFSAATAIFYLIFFVSLPAVAQSDQDTGSGSQCFPWQEFKDGRCVAKPSQSPPPPALAPSLSGPTSNPCTDGTRNLSSQCPCPGNTHPDVASGRCTADSIDPARRTDETIVCKGGTAINGNCACPAGFNLMPATGNLGGTCVKTNAENCLGGELTVSGTCLCNGQVVMSGETYLLEYTSGKCVPKRCPIATLLRDGKCVATSAATPPAATVEPETASRSASPKKTREKPVGEETGKEDSEEADDHRHCAHGMIRSRSGCIAAHRRTPGSYGNAAASFRQYYRMYQVPGSGGMMGPPN
jgi:hypothetical protein